MSGHSKWSKIKHQKASTDASRGKIFTKLSNAISIAVKESGGNDDPDSNFRLRLAIEKARDSNMPKDKIEKAIVRGKGKDKDFAQIEQNVYEAFGPSGIGIIIEATTDNKQRTVSAIKNVLERGGGVLATTGAVSHMFTLVGLIHMKKQEKSFDKIMEIAIDAGASDIEDSDDIVFVYTKSSDLSKVKDKLEERGLLNQSFELTYKPTTLIKIENRIDAEKILKLLSELEEMDDVQKVSANFDIPDEYLT